MKRYVDLKDISDGKLYGEEDMVKADCLDCSGCSKCCRGMGNSILLDPYDVWRLTGGLSCSMEGLLSQYAELNVAEGVILPNLKMTGEEEKCSFLNENGRCSIHSFRPGLCRLFPLGRYYENGSYRYFLQTGECDHQRVKIKVKKWIDEPKDKRYKEFILSWHEVVNHMEELVRNNEEDEYRKNLNMLFLRLFYLMPYQKEASFYEQFEERRSRFYEAVS
ncbi:MAG: YkgJ family cysteine cluster protein [Lachnospiraceae bacterium]|nr:YkgJ family cysteine cluster protein [Lachnospiraceae bacterium]